MGSAPGRFVFQNLRLTGRSEAVLDLSKFLSQNIELYDVSDGVATVVSNHADPQLIYQGELNVKPGYDGVEWLVLITFFLVYYFLASRIVKYVMDFKVFGAFPRRDIYFLTVFFILLSIPMLKINKADVSKKENRALAEKPDITKIFDEQYNYGALFDAWYSDRFWARDRLIELHNWLGWGQQRKGNEKVSMGLDGWMFYKLDHNELDFLNAHPATDFELERSAQFVADLAAWCRRNNKAFYFFVAPNKHRVYGEYHEAKRKVNPDSLSMCRRFIRMVEKKGIPVIYPLENLLEAKKEGKLLYWKHDTHWNARGAYIGYVELMKRVNSGETSFGVAPPGFVPCKWYGRDMEPMYPDVPPDDNAHYVQHDMSSDIKVQGPSLDSMGGITTLENPRKEGKVVVYRDSFMSALAPYLAETFGEVTTIWRYHQEAGDYEKYLQHANIIILETVERYVPFIGNGEFILK